MLITISGMVGSGKSTTASAVMEMLEEAGLKPRYLRFRYLNLFAFSKPGPGVKRAIGDESATRPSRGNGFALRRLTASLTLGYAARIVSFRLARIGAASRCDVLDRYFYDNLVHYHLTSRRERLYASLLQRLIPTPDLALLVAASEQIIQVRRANYAPEYVVTVAHRYSELPRWFPGLVRICTDPDGGADIEIRRAVEAAIGPSRT